ncbi:MAG: hypothetical protein MJ246_03185 [Clostridia bacterium]|nr:hypothetical protein [Clostridia bacterium]
MNNLPNTLTVYEKKRIFLTDDELKENGYDGMLTDLRSACERAIGQKIKVYSSNINAISLRKLDSLSAYEVDYYHIHRFDKIYIEEIIYKVYRDSGFRIDNVFISADRDINIDVKLSTNMTNVSSIVKIVNIERLKEKLDEYITLNYSASIEVRVKFKDVCKKDEVLRFNC